MKINSEKIKNAIFFAGLKKKDYEFIQYDIVGRNQTNLKVLSMLTAVYMLIMIAVSFQNGISNSNRFHFIWCLGICVGILILSLVRVLKTKIATLLVVYLYLGTIYSYGIAIGCTQTSQTSVSFLIFIMVGPLIFYDMPVRLNCFNWVFNIIFLLYSLKLKTPTARDTDLVNGISYGVISCVLNYLSMVIKVRRVWLEKKMRILSLTDGLTNLKNRNCFEHQYSNYAKKAKKDVTCIYIDVNGLHKLNNSQGHEAGDQMLKYLAEQIILLFGQDDSYRIGGDEYVVFCYDEDMDVTNQKIEDLSERMKEKNYYISVGMANASVDELNMDDLIKKADAEMFFAKSRYYEQKGCACRKNR